MHSKRPFVGTGSTPRFEFDSSNGSFACAIQIGDSQLGIEMGSRMHRRQQAREPSLDRQFDLTMQEAGDLIATGRQLYFLTRRQGDIVFVPILPFGQFNGVFSNIRTHAVKTELEEADVS